ncbi:MAG: hypothetical protein RDU89_09995 [bacterium]|nr:hypothetical protein [bacterium]
MRKRLGVALALLAMTLSPAPTLACEEGPPPAAAVQPLHPTLVTLEALDVRVTVMADRSEVQAAFTLRNTGPATTVLMGFAEWQPEEGEPCTGMHDLRVSVDGSEVPVKRDPDVVPEPRPLGEVPAWHTWEVDFASGQTRRVSYSCWSVVTLIQEGRLVAYNLEPAAAWHDSTGAARVVLELLGYPPYSIPNAQPAGYRFEGDALVWEWQDSERWHQVTAILSGLSLLKSVYDRPGTSVFYRAKEWEELSLAGNHEELLAAVERHRDDEGLGLNPFLVPLYEARGQLALGRTGDAVRNWQHILDLTLPEGHDYWRLYPAQEEAYYQLARHSHAAGDQDCVAELYEQLKRRPSPGGLTPPLVLLRWMESLLPPEFTVGQPPVVRAVLKPGPPIYITHGSGGWLRLCSLVIDAEDPDADLVRLEWTVWHPSDDSERAARGEALVGPTREIHSLGDVWIRPGVPVLYWVDAYDQKGNHGSTGVLEYLLPEETPGAAGEPQGEGPGGPPAPFASGPSVWLLAGGGVIAGALGALAFALRGRQVGHRRRRGGQRGEAVGGEH